MNLDLVNFIHCWLSGLANGNVISEVGGRTLYRLLCRDAGGETEGTLLTETVPSWVADIVVNRNLPKLIKVPFYLLPHPASGIKCVKKYAFLS